MLSHKFLQFYKYIFVSFIALLVDYSVYVLILKWTMISVPTAAVIGYSSGIVVSYFLIKCKVFGHGWLSGKPRIEFSLFVFSSIIGLIVTYFVAAYIIFLFGQQPQLAKLGSSVLSFFVVYFFRKKIVFRYSYTSD